MRETNLGVPRRDSTAVDDHFKGLRDLMAEPRSRDTPAPHGPVVLVVEDNVEVNRLVSRALASTSGYRVLSAHDGREGLAIAIAERPDLIVSDMMMPELTGDELVRAIRKRPELDATLIVLLTARADERLRVDMLRGGTDDYLTKPFSVEELRARVANLLARKRSEQRKSQLIDQIERVTEANMAVSDAIASLPASSLGAVLQTIALKAQTLTSAKYAAVGLGTDPRLPFERWVSVGMRAELVATMAHPPRPIGVLGLVARSAQSVRLRDLRVHPEHCGLPADQPPMTSFLGTPIRNRGEIIGNLYLANKLGADEFTDQDQRIVEMLAARVGSAIETARIYQTEGMERAWLQAVVDQMPEGIVLFGADGTVIARNRTALALASETTPALELELPDGSPVAFAESPGARALALGEAVGDLELVARRSDGVRIPVLVSAAPVRDPDGTLAGATMILRDISMQKEIERLREEWSAIVAHDLQQPVNSIMLGVELVLWGELGPRERATAQRIRDSTTQLGRMIRDLKEVSTLESRHLALTRTSIDVAALAREVAGRCLDLARRVVIETPAEPVMVSCDPGRIEQVLANLLSNAAKYGDEATEIDLAVEVEGTHAKVAVGNRGRGIPADEIDTLFDRYVRARSARASSIPGSGLGLYIAKGLIEAHGGRIWATSVLGGTTTFCFTLPLLAAADHLS
jgi:signal transduction histidine kinase/DNA-binding response OmpR family regulator